MSGSHYQVLIKLIEQDNVAAVATLLCNNPNFRINRMPTIVFAAACNSQKVVSYLLFNGVDPDSSCKLNTTALIRAANNNNIEICKLLIDYHADLNITTIYGTTALHYAARNHNSQITELLMSAGADPTIKAYGKTPAEIAHEYQTQQKDIYQLYGAEYYFTKIAEFMNMNVERRASRWENAIGDTDIPQIISDYE